MHKKRIDIRDEILKNAGYALLNRRLTVGDYEYVGEDAINIGLDLVDIVERFDREFNYKKSKNH